MNSLTNDKFQHLKTLCRTSTIIFCCILMICYALFLSFKDNTVTTSIVQLLYPEKNIERLQFTEDSLLVETPLSEKIELFTKVFIHNSLICIVVILISYIPFCFLAQWALLINCFLNVVILTTLSNISGGFSYQFWLNEVFIHGIPEFIALSIAYAIGLHICLEMTLICVKKSPLETSSYVSNPKTVLKLYFFLVLPIIFIASIIEGFV